MFERPIDVVGKARVGTLGVCAVVAALVLRPPCWPLMQEGGVEAGHWATKLNLFVAVIIVVCLAWLLDRLLCRLFMTRAHRAKYNAVTESTANLRALHPIWPALFAGMFYKTVVDLAFATRGGVYGQIESGEQWLNIAGLATVVIVGYVFTRFRASRSGGGPKHSAGASI